MLHDLKIAPEWFETVRSGVKTFEVRKDDRDFKPNDVLLLREFDGTKYTGRQLKADVRFVLRGEYCREGYCIMSIVIREKVDERPKNYLVMRRNLLTNENVNVALFSSEEGARRFISEINSVHSMPFVYGYVEFEVKE